VIILSGAGDNFCSGHDLGTPEEKKIRSVRPFPKGMRGEYMRSRQMFLDNTLRWRDLDKPTIAQVHGLCIFGGWMFAAAMDLVVAFDDAKFSARLPSIFDSVDMPPRKAERKSSSRAGSQRRGSRESRLRQTWWCHARLEERWRMRRLGIGGAIAVHGSACSKWAVNSRRTRWLHTPHPQRPFASNGARNQRHHEAKLEGKGLPKRMAGVEQALKK